MEYLYHYTSLDTLALILCNKSIRFNNLLFVDDMEEAKTQDMGLFGRFVYVSCWTKDSVESIPLWSMYTPNMQGVRIRLPINPFKKYKYRKGEFAFLQNDVETCINLNKLYQENKASIVLTAPHLIKVKYTDKYNELFPAIKTESYPGAVHDYLQAKRLEDLEGKSIHVSYSLKELGKCKRTNWEFQKEWRYIISLNPIGLQENDFSDFEYHQESIRRIEDKDLEPPYKQIFLELDDMVWNNIDIVFGPRMSEAAKIMAKAMLKYYCPNCTYRDSSLQIR